MMNKVAAAVGALATLASAQRTPPNVPAGAQIGALDFPITCNVSGFGTNTFPGYFVATAPNYAGSGQKIYYNDVAATVVIPNSITKYAGIVNATQASALVKIHLSLTNASPADLDVIPNGLLVKNITIDSTKPATVHIPKTGILPSIGPVTVGAAGIEHIIHLGQISVVVNLQDAKGNMVFGPLNIDCGQQPVNFNVGVVNVGPKTSAGPLNISTGIINTFPAITNNMETGSFRYPYACNFSGPLGVQKVDLTVSGTIPTYIAPGAQFSLTDAGAFLRVPDTFNTAAKQAYPGLASYRFSVNTFNIKTVNASPAKINALKSAIVVNSKASGQLVLAIPQTGTLKIGPITAGTAGQDATLVAGQAAANVVYLDSTGKSLGSSSVVCNPVRSAVIIGLPVTTATPNAITQ